MWGQCAIVQKKRGNIGRQWGMLGNWGNDQNYNAEYYNQMQPMNFFGGNMGAGYNMNIGGNWNQANQGFQNYNNNAGFNQGVQNGQPGISYNIGGFNGAQFNGSQITNPQNGFNNQGGWNNQGYNSGFAFSNTSNNYAQYPNYIANNNVPNHNNAYIQPQNQNIQQNSPYFQQNFYQVQPVQPIPKGQPVVPQFQPGVNMVPNNPQAYSNYNIQPINPNVQPINPNVKPINPNVQPINPNIQPINPNVKPINPNVQPINPNIQPINPNIQPINPNVQPINPNIKPPNIQPVTPVQPIPVIPVQPNNFGNQHQGAEWLKFQGENNNKEIIKKQQLDINKFLEQQITIVEPSPAKKKLQELRQKGKKFEDERFPPNNNSLSGQWGNCSQWKDVKWFKLSEKIPKAVMFTGKPQPQDIKQGYLGDCYFLAGLAALAERPDRIYNLFLLNQTNELNYYSVKMLYKGKWMTIDMDEYVPFLYNAPAFTKSVENELWVVLLEKAWAKMYTSYKRIEAGYPQQPLHDLTGAPIKQIFIKKDLPDKEEEWNYLMHASRLEYAMVCSSNPGSDTNKSQSGVVQGHAYTLLNAIVLNHKSQTIRLVQLRNPWGKGEYTGKWSDTDPVWKEVSEAQKQRIGFKYDTSDGIFFMPFDTFWAEFRQITIAEINDDASYVYKSFKDKNKEGVYFRVDIKKQGFYSFQIDKTPERSFENKVQQNYRYPTAMVQFAMLLNGKIQDKKAYGSNARTTQRKFQLKMGTYIFQIRVDFDPAFQKDFDVNLAIYSEYPCIIGYASNQQASLLAKKPVKWTGEIKQNLKTNSWNPLGAYGYSQEKGWG